MAVELTPARADDISFISATERIPDYASFVGHWPAERHRRTMRDPAWIYLVARERSVALGFAILQGLDERHGNILLKRIAVADAGKGIGGEFLKLLIDYVFRETGAHRLWLEVSEQNPRAAHVYRKLGFVDEGRARESHLLPDGGRSDLIQMSILKKEWVRRA